MDLQTVVDWLKGNNPASAATPQGKTYLASPRLNYPTSEDVDFARQYDYSYGQPWAPEFNNKSVTVIAGSPNNAPVARATMGTNLSNVSNNDSFTGPLKDVAARAALASEGSALAKLGFDPTKFALDPVSGKKLSYSGLYWPKPDSGWVNAYSPDALVHESIHRGVEKLKGTPYWKKEFDPLAGDQEYLVRHLMMSKMGDPEASRDSWADKGKAQRDEARRMFNQSPYANDRRKVLDQMEDAAAQYIAAKRPGGPR